MPKAPANDHHKRAANDNHRPGPITRKSARRAPARMRLAVAIQRAGIAENVRAIADELRKVVSKPAPTTPQGVERRRIQLAELRAELERVTAFAGAFDAAAALDVLHLQAEETGDAFNPYPFGSPRFGTPA
jgi:hypothetical protein